MGWSISRVYQYCVLMLDDDDDDDDAMGIVRV
jgi:hypothetical protein